MIPPVALTFRSRPLFSSYLLLFIPAQHEAQRYMMLVDPWKGTQMVPIYQGLRTWAGLAIPRSQMFNDSSYTRDRTKDTTTNLLGHDIFLGWHLMFTYHIA
ncbi:hypothetical protein CC77DRAFT_734456 [Alternaria alternata]|jgi:hypothetical protein|uniref:Uncharacterized protein n=1 Tax=Alternaria alternata TaxID=5599 RepID=A0A177DRX5_ALTAL|nr:hypothetical protein CC77DRAFT_734456 [Alternaria alternata]OAG22534.1 hypothetical protein CC77DRAFT_734456 [Alternaria alternata]